MNLVHVKMHYLIVLYYVQTCLKASWFGLLKFIDLEIYARRTISLIPIISITLTSCLILWYLVTLIIKLLKFILECVNAFNFISFLFYLNYISTFRILWWCTSVLNKLRRIKIFARGFHIYAPLQHSLLRLA